MNGDNIQAIFDFISESPFETILTVCADCGVEDAIATTKEYYADACDIPVAESTIDNREVFAAIVRLVDAEYGYFAASDPADDSPYSRKVRIAYGIVHG